MTANATPAPTNYKEDTLPHWDLTEYYSGLDDPQIKADIAEVKASHLAFAEKYKGRVAELSGDELADAMEESARIGTPFEKLEYYGELQSVLEQNNKEYSAFNQSLSEIGAEIGEATQFFSLELKRIEDDAMEETLAGSPRLQRYAPVLEAIRRYRPHTLSDEVEGVLTKISPVDPSGLMNRLYDETRAQLRFPFRGEELTGEEIDSKRMSPDREERKEACEVQTRVLSENIYIPTFSMNAIIKDKQIDDSLRGYDGDMARRNLSNNVEAEVVNTLVDTVTSNYEEVTHRYNAIKAQLLGQESLAQWDMLAPLPETDDTYIPWEKAKEIVLDSYQSFSPEMAEIAAKFFDNGWIDAEPAPDKAPGAFSASGVYGMHPHVMLNYMGKPNDVMTLAHELGHGIHQYLEHQHQGQITPGTPLNLAETASIFGENVVFNRLLKEVKNPTERKMMLADKIDDEIGSIVVQASWVDFERRIHAQRREGELKPEDFAKHWKDVQSEREGPVVTEHVEGAGNNWSRIGHMFHTPFYMYAYSFGNLLVNSLFKAYEDGQVENFEQKYVEALSAGGSKHHSDLLAPFGLDASEPDFWQKGLDVVINRIDELERTIEEEKQWKASQQQAIDNEPVSIGAVAVVGAEKAQRTSSKGR